MLYYIILYYVIYMEWIDVRFGKRFWFGSVEKQQRNAMRSSKQLCAKSIEDYSVAAVAVCRQSGII